MLRRCLAASYNTIEAATPAFRDSTAPLVGIEITASAAWSGRSIDSPETVRMSISIPEAARPGPQPLVHHHVGLDGDDPAKGRHVPEVGPHPGADLDHLVGEAAKGLRFWLLTSQLT